jgi:hypothetical protein
VRLYLPATLPLLASWVAAGSAGPAGPAYAVTPALREWYREGDVEELEHVAQLAAADGSVELLTEDVAAPRRRVVLAVDADDAAVTARPDRQRAQVELAGTVPKSRWAAALVDDESAVPVVATAVANLVRAGIGDEDAQFALDEAAAAELGWYAVQELPHLLAAP